MVIRNFRTRIRYCCEKRGFSDGGKPRKSDICDHLQLELDLGFLTGETVFGESRSLARRCCKMTVSPASATSAAHYEILAVGHIVYDKSFRRTDDRSAGNGDYNIGAVCTVKF